MRAFAPTASPLWKLVAHASRRCVNRQKVQKHKPKRLGSLEAWRSDKILEAAQQVPCPRIIVCGPYP